jgi:penicillin-binding protein 1A
MVRIDRRSGRKVYGAWPSSEPKAPVIWEAFKPESEPRRSVRQQYAQKSASTPAGTKRPAAKRTRQRDDSDDLPEGATIE